MNSLSATELRIFAAWHEALAAEVKALHDELARATPLDAFDHVRQLLACARLLQQMAVELSERADREAQSQ